MRYIYYVVAALIFLAVVNLSARFLGNDTQELLSDLNPEQQVTASTNETTPKSAEPPVVGLDTTQVDATKPAAVSSQTTEHSEPTAAVAASVDTKIDSAPDAVAMVDKLEATVTPDVAEVEPGSKVAALTTNAQLAEETQIEHTAQTNADDAVDNAIDNAAVASIDAAAAAVANTADTMSEEAITTEVGNAEAPAKEAVAAAVTAPSVTVTPQPATESELVTVTTPEVAVATPADVAHSATPIMDSATAIEPEASDTKKVIEPAEPGLIQSLGDSAGSAATAVVGGAQQAVETVVEAARSLIDKDDNKDEAPISAANIEETPQPVAQQTIVNPAVAVVAAAVTDAAQAERDLTQEIASTSTAVSAPNAEQVAAPVPTTAQAPSAEPAPKPETKQTHTVLAPGELTTAPAAVLALVNRHPGKVLMVGFFSPSCLSCKPSLAWLNEMRREYWAQGLQVIGVNLSTQAEAKSYLQDAPVSFEILHDPQRELASAFWLAEQPSTYLIDASGKLLSMHKGHSAARLGEYEDAIRAGLEQRKRSSDASGS